MGKQYFEQERRRNSHHQSKPPHERNLKPLLADLPYEAETKVAPRSRHHHAALPERHSANNTSVSTTITGLRVLLFHNPHWSFTELLPISQQTTHPNPCLITGCSLASPHHQRSVSTRHSAKSSATPSSS